MKIVCQFALTVAFGVCFLQPALAAPDCKPNLTVVASERVHTRATEAHSREMLCVLAAQLDIAPDVTRLVLLQVAADDAMVEDINRATPIREEHVPGRPGSVYFVWLIGDNDDNKLAVLLASALADAAGRRPLPNDFRAAVHRAVVAMGAKIDKNSLLHRPH